MLKFLVQQEYGKEMNGKERRGHDMLGHRRGTAFVQCTWVEELEMVVLEGPVPSRLKTEISCYGIFLLGCCHTHCVCPKSYSTKAFDMATIPTKAVEAQLR